MRKRYNKTDSLKLNDIQKFTKEVFSEVAQQYEIPIATFDKLKADSKDSLDEVSTNLKNELKRMTELRDKYDRSKKEHQDAGLSENLAIDYLKVLV